MPGMRPWANHVMNRARRPLQDWMVEGPGYQREFCSQKDALDWAEIMAAISDVSWKIFKREGRSWRLRYVASRAGIVSWSGDDRLR